MPWRGPEVQGEFPTLGYVVADWIEEHCAIPDGEHAGEPFELSDEQLRFLLFHYRLRPKAKAGQKPSAAFFYRRSQLVRPQKWGKGPLSAAVICAEADGPVLFDGWDSDGEPVGKHWATPWIQVVAVSEDQTDNVWEALVPMIELGELKADIPDTGITRINLAHGKIEPVTSAAISRLGQRITFAVHDETHSWTKSNRGDKLADTQRRNLAGMGGRSMETTNAWDPAEESVAQVTFDLGLEDVYRDYPAPLKGSIRNKRDRAKVLKHAYAGAPWVDLNRIDAEIQELLPRDPGQAERFFFNRIVAGAATAFDSEGYNALVDPEAGGIAAGRLVTLGFDGALTQDSTGLVATDVESGHQVVVGRWERPDDLPVDDESWMVPVAEVHEAVAFAFATWNVWKLYGDPPHWKEDLNQWAGEYGEERIVLWWTNHRKRMAYALKAWKNDMRPGVMSHGPLSDDPEAIADHQALMVHIANAVKRPTRMRDEDDGTWLWLIGKDGAKSPRKIDLAMAACLSWEARGDAIRTGATAKPEYTTAGF